MKRVKAENYRNNDKDKGSGSPIHIERKVFDCGGYEWVIPAAYSDAQEINIDICRRIPVEALRSFRDKWGDKDRALLTQEQSALRNCDDPLRLPVKFSIEINGEEIRGSGWNKTVWQPDDSGEGNIRAKELLQLYGLAPDSAWLFYRAVFHWEREMADIKSMSLLLSSNRVTRPSGYHFTTAVNCAPFTVTVPHRCREKEYRLHILSCRCKTMDDLECGMPDMHKNIMYWNIEQSLTASPGKLPAAERISLRSTTVPGRIHRLGIRQQSVQLQPVLSAAQPVLPF